MERLDGTPESARLCRKMARRGHGTCLLGFSRGKDSIAAWLYLRQWFDTIIPFHCAAIPHLSFVDESLAYYEQWFGTKIVRCLDGNVRRAIANLVLQDRASEAVIDRLQLTTYNTIYVANRVRQLYGTPQAWCAFGISAADSLDRRIYVNRYQGHNEENLSFYPCWDWSRSMVLAAIRTAGIKLPKDYVLSNRTVAGLPTYRWLARLEQAFPADFEKVETVFPLVRAILARNEFRQRAQVQSGQEGG